MSREIAAQRVEDDLVARVEIDRDGKIIVFAGRSDNQTTTNEWDDVQ